MDKKTKKEIDKEVKDIHKTTVLVNNRIRNIMGLKNAEEGESDEENEEIDDMFDNVNDDEVSAILQKAEQEMKEEEEEKKRQMEEKKREEVEKKKIDEKQEQILRDELANLSDEE